MTSENTPMPEGAAPEQIPLETLVDMKCSHGVPYRYACETCDAWDVHISFIEAQPKEGE